MWLSTHVHPINNPKIEDETSYVTITFISGHYDLCESTLNNMVVKWLQDNFIKEIKSFSLNGLIGCQVSLKTQLTCERRLDEVDGVLEKGQEISDQ